MLLPTPLHAGRFSTWFRGLRNAVQHDDVDSDVPCGDCTACCRSSMFIVMHKDEHRSLARIPSALVFPAPGRDDLVVMGYNERGECPMFVDGGCSIYEDRPQTCRTFDCRVFAATGIDLGDGPNSVMATQVRRWQFAIDDELDERELSALMSAAQFLQDHRAQFPPDLLPQNRLQLAIVAVRVFPLFLDPPDETVTERIDAIVQELRPH